MLDACRPKGRLFYCLLTAFLVSVVAMWTGVLPPVAMAAGPAMTTVTEDKIFALQGNDIRRSVYDRIVNAVIATAISIVVALHDHLGLR